MSQSSVLRAPAAAALASPHRVDGKRKKKSKADKANKAARIAGDDQKESADDNAVAVGDQKQEEEMQGDRSKLHVLFISTSHACCAKCGIAAPLPPDEECPRWMHAAFQPEDNRSGDRAERAKDEALKQITAIMKEAELKFDTAHPDTCLSQLRDLEAALAGVDAKYWYLAFKYLIPAGEANRSNRTWCADEIVKKKLSWEAACEAFRKKFDTSDPKLAAQKRYRKLRQGDGTLATYINEFTTVCEELGKGVPQQITDVDTIQKFVGGTKKEFIRLYARGKSLLGKVINNLQESMDYMRQLENAEESEAQLIALHEELNSNFKKRDGGKSRKRQREEAPCPLHPDGNHPESACRQLKKQKAEKSGANAGQPSARKVTINKGAANKLKVTLKKKGGKRKDSTGGAQASNAASAPAKKKKDKSKVTCFGCGEKGHYKSECPAAETTTGGGQQNEDKEPPADDE
jgi:hypothetical protein